MNGPLMEVVVKGERCVCQCVHGISSSSSTRPWPFSQRARILEISKGFLTTLLAFRDDGSSEQETSVEEFTFGTM